MKALVLLLWAATRSQLRWAISNIYYWLVLGPIVLGITYATLARLAQNTLVSGPAFGVALTIAAAFELCFLGLSLSRAASELYHLRRPESCFDAFGLRASTHLHHALLLRFGQTAVLTAAILLIRAVLPESEPVTGLQIGLLVLFAALTATAEMYAALHWVHWNHLKDKRTVWAGGLISLCGILAASVLLALVIALRADLLRSGGAAMVMTASASLAAMIYVLLRRAHERWRILDLEFARRLQARGRFNVFSARIIDRRLGPVAGAQIARDLQLTLRAFSSAVYVVVGIAVLWIIVMLAAFAARLLPAAAAGGGWLDATWLPPVLAIKAACVLAVASLAGLLPILIAYELPHFWLERATGVMGLDIWRAKLWYARIVSAPAPLAALIAGLLTGKVPFFYTFPLFAECVLLWWVVSSIMGALAFEMPARPGLAIVVMVTAGLAVGFFGLIFWPIAPILYVQGMHSLTDRGRHMARYFLITEGD